MRDLYRYRDLIWMLVVRDLKVRYRRSVIGFVWTMLQPLLTMLVLTAVFSSIFRFNIKNFPVYALSGIMFWNFFSQSITVSMNSLKSHAYILQKVPVPLAIFPVTTVLSGLINLQFTLVPMFAILVATGHKIGPSLFFLPVAILVAALFTLGAGLLLSPLAVFFSDVVELVGVILTMLYFLTPIFYPLSIVAGRSWFWVVRYNPIRSILEIFRDPIYLHKIPPLDHIAWALFVTTVMLIAGAAVFQRSSNKIPFYV
jgi:homopolymeric O-antigen transport system permease protein